MRGAIRSVLLGVTVATGCGPSSDGSDADPADGGPGAAGNIDAAAGTGVVTAQVGLAGGALVQAGMSLFFQGRPDNAGNFVSHERVLKDDGMNGDATAGDSTYTSIPQLSALAGATPGPRIGRIRVETKGADGKRHATAVDFSGLEVQ